MEKINFKKKFGQNFLSDKNLLRSIAEDASICEEDNVLEIGAGAGALTCELVKTAKKVISFEIDKELKPILEEKFASFLNVKFIFEDFLNYNEENLLNELGSNYKVVANLPYYITSPILTKLLTMPKVPSVIVVMVQKEVGERICAKCGSKNYGYLSAFIQYLAESRITRIVKRNMFYPMPNVDSCVVRLDTKNTKIDKEFVEFLKMAFSMKRKTLVNNISKSLNIEKDKIINAIESENLTQNVRAEDVDVLTMNNIFNKLRNCIKMSKNI